ncbi:hypothetical protein BGZ49_005565 [Haplosporangium sp. Z 27]|nr:hypothetical protein BGZ49_005565 [Haplosporangium sp. Z 27]
MDTSSSSINRGMTSESNDSPNSMGSLRPEAAHIHPQALPNALPNVLLPVRDLIESNSGIIDTLTTLSLEQISEMELTLQRAKMIKIQQLNPSQGAVSLDTTAKSSRAQNYGRPILPNPTLPSTAILRQQMHETGAPTIQNDSRPTLSPSIRTINGVPWLTFQYTTRNADTVITIRVDIDTVFEHNERSNDSFSSLIAPEFRRANCIYPSADGPEQDYKGTRREFERECNEQGWKLAYLNPTVLGGKKGLLQRAVVSLRNATAEQKSRRVKRLEKKMKEQESITRRQGTEQQQQHRGSVMAIPRISNMTSTSQSQRHDYRGHNHQNSITAQSSQSPRTLSWQPTLVSSLRNPTQSPNAQNAFSKSNLSRENLAWANIDDYRSEMQSQRSAQSNLDPTTYPLQRIPLQSSTSQPVDNIDSSNAFSTSKVALPLSSSSFDAIGVFINFDGFVQGRSQSLRICCDIDHVKVEELPFDFKKLNCVYPRSFIALGAEDLGESPLSESHQSQQWKFLSARQAEEIYLNEIGWKLASLNRSLLNGKRLLLQQALDAYRRRFLPATCHPRARVEPPFLTRMLRDSHDSELRPQETSGSYNSFSNLGQRKPRVQYRIKFHGHGASSRKAKRGMGSYESGQKSRASDDSSQDRDNDDNDDDDDDDDDGDDTDDDTDDNGDDELNVLSSSSIEDESSDSSSPEDAFHSQMSLLTFQGNIRTYCLGTGSGSARSRPRIKPITTSRVMNLRLPSSSPSNLVSSTTIRKRPNSGYPFQNQQQRQTHEGSRSAKRIRSHDPTEETDSQEERRPDDEEDTQEQDQTELDSVSSNSDVESKSSDEDLNQGNMDQYEEEDNWWMSRLQNSEYPEDHNFVSMTTEELIGALTSGYNSYIDDEEDESEEHTFF